jgi:hypothetical protein
MVKHEDEVPVVISGNKARAGVTGHCVRYVLAFGLAGSIIAGIVIGLNYGYGWLTQTISQMATRIDLTTLVFYAVPIALAAVAIVLLLGLWKMTPGGSHTSQILMRWRVVLQFFALCLLMAALYLSRY